MLNRSRGNELGRVERHSLIWRMLMVSSSQQDGEYKDSL